MSLEANKLLIRQHMETVVNQRDLSVIDEQVASDFVDHDAPTGLMLGPEGVKATIRRLHTAFPDIHLTIDDMIAEGDQVVVRNTWCGTHAAEFLGIPPTNSKVVMTGIVIWRITNGKIVERWARIDRSQLLRASGSLGLWTGGLFTPFAAAHQDIDALIRSQPDPSAWLRRVISEAAQRELL